MEGADIEASRTEVAMGLKETVGPPASGERAWVALPSPGFPRQLFAPPRV